MASKCLQRCCQRCSWVYLLSPVLICWGLSVLGVSLVTLVVTTSYRGVFPFGAPLWTSSLFLMVGCFLVFSHKTSDGVARSIGKAHVWFILSLGILTLCETLLALGLSLWHYLIVTPTLSYCTPDPTLNEGSGTTCECSEGFINPPSLMRIVYRFEGVSDCMSLGTTLGLFYNILTALYSLGVLLALMLCIGASKSLHTFGVCRETGVYTVTPAASMAATSRQASPDPPPVHSMTSQYNFATGFGGISAPVSHRRTGDTIYLPSSQRVAVSRRGRLRLASTGSTYQSAMI